MKKIVFVIGKLSKGGAERVVSILANKFTTNHNVTIIIMSKSEITYDIEPEIKIINLKEQLVNNLGPFKIVEKLARLRKLLKEIKPDVVISFLSDINIYTILANVGLKTTIIVSERNYPKLGRYVPITKLIFFINKLLYRLADGIVFQTDEIAFCFPPSVVKKCAIIENPIALDLCKYSKTKQEKEIVAVVRLTKQKNVPLLIEAYKGINDIFKEYRLSIYGDGPLMNSFLEQYKDLIESGNIIFHGFQNDIYSKIKNASVFVLTSDVEGMPNALMEAMAIGIPCVATDSMGGGVRKLTNNGEYALITPIRDSLRLSENINYLLSHPVEAENMAHKASEHIISQYNLNNICGKWVSYIESFKK